MDAPVKSNPYGISDFANLRNSNAYFVDRTSLFPALEQLHYQLFLRPRRFGKSLLVSMMHYYYDVNSADRFDELFGGTWLHEHPTDNKNKFLVMHFDFSSVEGETLEHIQQDFEAKCKIALDAFVIKYREFLPEGLPSKIHEQPTFGTGMELLKRLVTPKTPRIFILVDEYDNFSNRLLAQAGEQAYRELCHGTGYFKGFFAMLKAANAVITNIFLTGVSPMTLDDVTSGFNIADNVSMRPQLATLCGFTHDDIRACLDYYAAAGQFPLDRETAFSLVTDWYDHYRFSDDNDSQVINPALFMGFLIEATAVRHFPREMVDENLRTDYYKLRHLVITNGRLNGKFHALETVVAEGRVTTKLIRSFQAETLVKPESFLSLLYYYGMVTIGDVSLSNVELVIPNLTMKQFVADFLRHGYADACQVNPRATELANALDAMAIRGIWRPAVELAAAALRETISARDLLDGEKTVQAALAALLTVGNVLIPHTEHNANCGFADLALAPMLALFPEIQYGALIEVKYLSPKEKLSAVAKRKLLAEATAQLERYAADRQLAKEWRLRPDGPVTLIRLCLVFRGGELLLAQEI